MALGTGVSHFAFFFFLLGPPLPFPALVGTFPDGYNAGGIFPPLLAAPCPFRAVCFVRATLLQGEGLIIVCNANSVPVHYLLLVYMTTSFYFYLQLYHD